MNNQSQLTYDILEHLTFLLSLGDVLVPVLPLVLPHGHRAGRMNIPSQLSPFDA